METISLFEPLEEPVKRHIFIGAYHEPPVLVISRSLDANVTTRYSGFIKDVINHLSEALGFTYEFIDVYVNPFNITAGPSEIFLERMRKKEIDLTARLLVLSSERYALIDFSSPFIIEPLVLLQPFPQWKIEFNAIFQPFQPTVWVAMFISFLLVAIFLTLAVSISRQRKPSINPKSIKTTASDVFMYIFSIITSQGGELESRWMPTCLIAGSWCLVAVVLVNGYGSTLTSFLSVRSYETIVNDWEELATEHMKFVVERDSVVEDVIMKSDLESMMKLANYLRRYPHHRYSSFNEFKNMTKDGLFVVPLQKLAAQERVYKTMKLNKGECSLTFGSPSRTFTTMHSIGMRKGFPWKEAINMALLVMTDVGITERMKFTYVGKTEKCRIENQSRKLGYNVRPRPLKLRSFYGLFIILGLVYCIGVLIFLGEVAVNIAWHNRRLRY